MNPIDKAEQILSSLQQASVRELQLLRWLLVVWSITAIIQLL